MPTALDDVRDFLAQRRVALVGLSRNPKDFSHVVFREMSQRGYDMVPVNPAAAELEGRRCFARMQEISPPVDGVLIMTAARDTDRVVRDCMEAGVQKVPIAQQAGFGFPSRFCELPEARCLGVTAPL